MWVTIWVMGIKSRSSANSEPSLQPTHFWDRLSYAIVQANLKFLPVFLPQPPKWWENKLLYQSEISSLKNISNKIGAAGSGYISEFYKTLKEEVMPVLYKLQKIKINHFISIKTSLKEIIWCKFADITSSLMVRPWMPPFWCPFSLVFLSGL